MQRNARWGRVAHVFVAVAVALPLAVAGTAVGVALLDPAQTTVNRGLLVVIAVAFAAVVGWVAHLPEVRPVEVAAARTLLGLDLPGVTAPEDWRSRRRGASWLLVLVVVGLVVAVGLLYLLPVGVGLVAHPFTGADELARPLGGGALHTGSGWDAAWLVLPGALALLGVVVLVRGAGAALARWAPRVLGPTLVEQVAVAAERERDLARANALARDLHDSLGHRLTAMTVQASAARRLLRADPAAAERALSAVEELGRTAQADVDAAVGALRGSADGTVAQEPGPGRHPGSGTGGPCDVVVPLRALCHSHPAAPALDLPRRLVVPKPLARTVIGVAREALTNAARHGSAPVEVRLLPGVGEVVLEVRNAVRRPDPDTRSGRSGLQGLREQVLLAGGTLTAHGEEGLWLVRATLPNR